MKDKQKCAQTWRWSFLINLCLYFLMFTSLARISSQVNAVAVTDDQDDFEGLCRPQHVHIAYGDALTSVVIVWATKANCSTLVEYGANEWTLNKQATGNSTQFWEQNAKGLQYLHRVELTELAPLTTYFYRPVSNESGKGPFYFKTPQLDQNWSPDFLVFGDLGVHTETIPSLVEEALSGDYTALLHVGDFAYNLRDDDGKVGDRFMELIEPVAAFLPYMTAPGNHEYDSDTFTHYRHRFSMPESQWPMSVDKLWYSFDVGPVHFISYSTGVFFTLNGQMVQKQLDWLVADLKKANYYRDRRPWIIAFGHRPMYCYALDEDCVRNDSLVRAGLEDVFYHYGVDIVLQAHEHNYERLYPVYKGVVLSTGYVNPPAPVQIISGAAGSKMGPGQLQNPDKPEWSAVRLGNCSLNSYGWLQVVNTSHAYWEQRSVHNHSLLDTLWIVQYHHGKFDPSKLPSNLSSEIKSPDLPSIFGDDDEMTPEEKTELKQTDNTVRLVIGVCFAIVFGVLLVIFLVKMVFRRRRYRILRRWNPDDLNYGRKLLPRNNYFPDDDDPLVDPEVVLDDSASGVKKLLQGS